MQGYIEMLDKSKKMEIIKKTAADILGDTETEKYGILQGRG